MQQQRQEERQVSNNEEKYICGYDFGNHRRNFICPWYVYGTDSGVECVQTGCHYGGDWSNRTADYGACMEKDGKQRTN